jgi:hypothetical protein
MAQFCHKTGEKVRNIMQVTLSKEESANLAVFAAACKARAEGYAAGMEDAVQVYLRQMVEGKKKQEVENGRVPADSIQDT